MTKRAAIILAGGKGKRFQTTKEWEDKALAELEEKPLLVHAIENIQESVDEVVVVVDENASRTDTYSDILDRFQLKNIKIVTDIKVKNLSGPLIAILTGLKFTKADYCLTVPADVPMLNPKVADYLFNEVNGSHVAVPMWPNGRLETLLMVLERTTALKIADLLSQLERSHPDDIIRGAQKVMFLSPLGEIKNLDPELRSFVNINCKEDLTQLKPRQGEGSSVKNVNLDLGVLPDKEIQSLLDASSKRDVGCLLEASELFLESAEKMNNRDLFFWAGIAWEYEAKCLLSFLRQESKGDFFNQVETAFLKAAQSYRLEAEIYMENRCYLLAERAKANKSWCEAQVEKLAFK
jgi:molybdopterin-guanine dinucleotide biosynthesis protein A